MAEKDDDAVMKLGQDLTGERGKSKVLQEKLALMAAPASLGTS
jgi:hypothetical protein